MKNITNKNNKHTHKKQKNTATQIKTCIQKTKQEKKNSLCGVLHTIQ